MGEGEVCPDHKGNSGPTSLPPAQGSSGSPQTPRLLASSACCCLGHPGEAGCGEERTRQNLQLGDWPKKAQVRLTGRGCHGWG